MAPLDRALALAEVHDVAVMIADDLELDVPRALQVFLEIDIAVAERSFGLALSGAQRVRQFAGGADNPHAAASAAGHGLDDHRDTRSP